LSFYSQGPNGKIKKVISYKKLEDLEVYNLGFGDVNEATGEIDDVMVSNNLDRDKILSTIANSVLYFFRKYPTARLIFVGSTPARTRLYIMQISKHWNFVNDLVSVQGLINLKWEPFEQNGRYDAILIAAKKL
jgi:hypothetical protein